MTLPELVAGAMLLGIGTVFVPIGWFITGKMITEQSMVDGTVVGVFTLMLTVLVIVGWFRLGGVLI